MSIYAGQSPKQLYRSFFRHIRHLPDPHIWSVLQPRFRYLLERSRNHDNVSLDTSDEAESSTQAVIKAQRSRKRVEDELRKLQMAVSGYTHAIRRLMGDCYGRTGPVRWELINNLLATSTPPVELKGRPPLPPVLRPLTPKTTLPPETMGRARTTVPAATTRRREARIWTRQWQGVQVPLAITSPGGPRTGWEGRGVVESLRILGRLDPPTPAPSEGEVVTRLPTWHHLSSRMRRIFPVKLRPSPVPQYEPPPPRATRQNPGTWSGPHRLTARMLRRTYQRLCKSIPWVSLMDKEKYEWKSCTYESLYDTASAASVSSTAPGKGKRSKKVKVKAERKVTMATQAKSSSIAGKSDDVHWL